MASFVYDSALTDLTIGAFIVGSDTFRMMLVGTAYAANKATHNRRDDVTNEVTGTGYTAGGAVTTCTPTTTANTRTLVFAATSWATATFTAGGAVIYKARGGTSSADELVCYLDFGGAVSSAGGTFAVSATTIILSTDA